MGFLAASTGDYNLSLVLGNLLLVIVAARLAAEIAERILIPPVVGEIVVGVILGPSVLGWIDPLANQSVGDMIVLLGEIGVILLLMQVGLEMDLDEMAKVGRPALFVALIGVAAPFAAGFGVASAFGEGGEVALFIGAAMTATSVGITARVLGDLHALSRPESRVVLGAAVADDVLGLVILTIVVKVTTEGSISTGVVLETIGLAAGFLLVTGLLAVFVIPRFFDRTDRLARSSTTPVVIAFALTLAFSLLADQARLAFIIGAFMAGLGIGRTSRHERIEEGLKPLGYVFIPVFFASIGINADLEAMFRPSVLALASVLTITAILGKLASGLGVGRMAVDRLLIGFGMTPRGEVGLIFASIGLTTGVLDDEIFGALLLMVLVTTLVAPLLLRRRLTTADIVPDESTLRPWTSVETAHLLDELLNTDEDEWWEIVDRRRVESRVPEIGAAMSRLRAQPDFHDKGLNAHLHSLHRLKQHLDDPRRDVVVSRAIERTGLIEVIALSSLVDSIIDDGHAAISAVRTMSPDSLDDVMQILSLADAMRKAVRGPDPTVPAELVSGDEFIILSAYVVSALSIEGIHRAALDEAIGRMLR